MSPVAPDLPALPKRWPWLLLGLAIGVLALSVLGVLHQREETARRAEGQATLFASELRDAVREITIFGNTVRESELRRALRPVIASTAATSSARLARLEATLGTDPRIDDLRRQLAAIQRTAASNPDPVIYGERLTTAANRTARTADAIARSERNRARLIARETMAGGAIAVLAAMGLIAFVLQHAHRLLAAAGRRQAEQLQDLADRDPLTGLNNRRRLSQDLARLAGSVTEDAPVQVLICDLDGFKTLNDTLGHDAGDELLVAFGRRVDVAVGNAGTVYRLGGDEFCVLSDPGVDVAPLVREAVAGTGNARDPVRGSAGLALWPTEAPTAREAMRLADERMYAAKDARRAAA
ncbi:GGDEF domain-containing protein [Baekduia sp. Peel2402]|uniref:GGDEF domain-containing protein n=1 Tax=Baekduia sp. Peel2402 TaxID=3458296 RepID=UPI00403EDB6E